jgi:hypothetical protein
MVLFSYDMAMLCVLVWIMPARRRVFTVDWTAESISMRIDNATVSSYTGQSTEKITGVCARVCETIAYIAVMHIKSLAATMRP